MIERDLTLNLIENIGDKELANTLKDISNKATIALYKDSIWGVTVNSRENAIKEYARLYKNYPNEIMSALKDNMDQEEFINYWAPVISISKFFYYLEKYDSLTHGIWFGTKKDYTKIAGIRKSKYYLHPVEPDSANVPIFLERGLQNFREIKN